MQTIRVDEVVKSAVEAAQAGHDARAWKRLRPLLTAAKRDVVAARAVAETLECGALDRDRRLAIGRRLLERWPDELAVVSALGEAAEHLLPGWHFNDAPPVEPLFGDLVAALIRRRERERNPVLRAVAARALTCAARAAGRRYDAACEDAHRYLLAFEEENWRRHFAWGDFLKSRGRFAEALDATREAARRGGSDVQPVIWNLGICATALGDGATALEQWRRIGCTVASGDDGLPVGRFGPAQVRLAQRPLAVRDAALDDPGGQETVWIERLSPCHGRVVSALVDDLGVDYGDVVLHDGVPVGTLRAEGRSAPIFPHLLTLRREAWPNFAFAGTQQRAGQIAELGSRLGGGAELYVHTEYVRMLCPDCAGGEAHAHEAPFHPVVRGKLVVPRGVPLDAVGAALLRETGGSTSARVLVPDLWAALGDHPRAEAEWPSFRELHQRCEPSRVEAQADGAQAPAKRSGTRPRRGARRGGRGAPRRGS